MAHPAVIRVRPADGLKFRHHATKVLHDGPFDADPGDLDIVRSLNWGALVRCDGPKAGKAPKAAPPKAQA